MVRTGSNSLRNSLFAMLDNRGNEISPCMHDVQVDLYEDWLWLDERIDATSTEIERDAALNNTIGFRVCSKPLVTNCGHSPKSRRRTVFCSCYF